MLEWTQDRAYKLWGQQVVEPGTAECSIEMHLIEEGHVESDGDNFDIRCADTAVTSDTRQELNERGALPKNRK